MNPTINIPLVNKHFKDLNPLDAGWEICSPEKSFGPNVRDYYLIHYIYKGSGIFECPSGVFKVGRGQAFVIKPGEVTTYTADKENPWEYGWIGFKGEYAEKFGELAPVITLGLSHFSGLRELSKVVSSTKEEYLCARLFDIYNEIFDFGTEEISYVKQVKNYIRTNYMKKISIEEIAGLVGLDRSYMTRIFKKAEGISPQEYLIQLRIKRGKEFVEKGFNISETAAMCGYSDVFSFSKAFKKQLGISPSGYLNLLSEKAAEESLYPHF